MIDLTPLDVRKKRGDFRKIFRGYDPEEVDVFLEVVAERFETLVNENRTLRERTDRLEERVAAQEGREKAVQEALVTAQELRDEIRTQARREADLLRREAEAAAEEVIAEAERRIEERKAALRELERTRDKFLRSFRRLLEQELDALEVEEARSPLDDEALEITFSAAEARESLPEVGAAADGSEPVDIEALAPDASAEAPAAADAPEEAEDEPSPEPEIDEPLWLLDEEGKEAR